MNYPLASSSWNNLEIEAIERVIRSGKFTMGEEVACFEKEFSKYIGSDYCVMVNSGSSANLLAVASLFYTKNNSQKLKKGDEVIVPAVSWSTTYYPLYQYGLRLKFVDIDSKTLNLDLEKLKDAITEKTKAILAVNLLGNPLDYSQLNSIIAGKDIIIIEDNCESLGAKFNGKMAGTFGIVGTFSFFYSHHISTMEGGMIVTNNEEIYQILLSLRAHGWTRNLPVNNLITSSKLDDPFRDSFRFVLPGYNVRPLELSGAIGREQIKKLPGMVKKRRQNAALFKAKMKTHPDLRIQKETGQSSWFGFAIIINEFSSLSRSTLIQKLQEYGFEVRPIVTGNFVNSEVIHYFNYTIHGDLLNADYIDKEGLFIGNHPYPLDDCIELLDRIL